LQESTEEKSRKVGLLQGVEGVAGKSRAGVSLHLQGECFDPGNAAEEESQQQFESDSEPK